jgi:predicted porin
MGLLKQLLLASTAGLIFVGGAQAADLPTTKTPVAPAPKSCLASFYDWLNASAADCPLSYMGITVYGTVDMGAGYQTHGMPFNGKFATGVDEFIQKGSNKALYTLVPNGISQSVIGIKASEPIGSTGWSFVGKVETGFDPYSMELANGPASMAENTTTKLPFQSTNADSSRAGQWDNSQGFVGVSNQTFGTLVTGRVNSLTLDGVNAYDPMGGSYAFSPIGWSGKVAGAGSTEDARYNTAVKYNVAINNFRLSAAAQFGGYEQGNGANGAYEIGAGADLYGFSFDAIYTYVKDEVNLGTFNGAVSPAGAPSDALKATLSDNDSVMLLAKYTNGPFKLYGGYEYIRYMNPSDTYPHGFSSIGDYPVTSVNSTAYDTNLDFHAMWVGAKYAVLSNVDVTGAYYHYIQDNFENAAGSTGAAGCGPNTKSPATGYAGHGTLSAGCYGTMNAVSGMVDWRPYKRLDVYAGVMFSQVTGGLATGYLHTTDLDPTVGLRLQF